MARAAAAEAGRFDDRPACRGDVLTTAEGIRKQIDRSAEPPLEVHDPVDDAAPVFDACYEHITRAVSPIVRILASQTS